MIGADCEQKGYVDLLTAIQNKVSFPLWVSIPSAIGNEPIPPTVGLYVNNARDELKNKYKVDVAKHFFGGHSMGGAGIAAWGAKNADDA